MEVLETPDYEEDKGKVVAGVDVNVGLAGTRFGPYLDSSLGNDANSWAINSRDCNGLHGCAGARRRVT